MATENSPGNMAISLPMDGFAPGVYFPEVEGESSEPLCKYGKETA
jgi:hypothetical protein